MAVIAVACDAGGMDFPACGFGSAWLTGPGMFGPPPDRRAAAGVLRRAVDGGIRLVDTADCYGPEVIEELVAEALHPYRDGVIISTKGGRIALGDSRWLPAGKPEQLQAACEASLRRLGLETIELYQLNAVDPDVPVEESVGALVELRSAGKIRHIGVCNVDTDQLARARAVSDIASVQDRFDLLHRENEPVLEACAAAGIRFLPWFPPDATMQPPPGSTVARMAARLAITPAQLALAWLRHRSPVMVPLPGTPDPVRFEQDLEALSLALDADDLRALTGDGLDLSAHR